MAEITHLHQCNQSRFLIYMSFFLKCSLLCVCVCVCAVVPVIGHGTGAIAALFATGLPVPACPAGIVPPSPLPANYTGIVGDVCNWVKAYYGSNAPYTLSSTQLGATILWGMLSFLMFLWFMSMYRAKLEGGARMCVTIVTS